MEILQALIQLLDTIVWPVTVIVVIRLFRDQIRERLLALKEVQYPGGSITMDVARLEAKVEATQVTSQSSEALAIAAPASMSIGYDPQLAIAQMRLEVDREVFRLSQLVLGSVRSEPWLSVTRIRELENKNKLDKDLAGNLVEFIEVANRIVHTPGLPSESKIRAAILGSSLVTQLHRRRIVVELERDFDGNLLWNMPLHKPGRDTKYYWWSAVAATLPEFDYDYGLYCEAAEAHNARLRERFEDHTETPPQLYILSLEEFISVLEFVETELHRLEDAWHNHRGDNTFEKANEWQWPASWGDIGWGGPIIRDRRLSLWSVEQELLETRSAINRWREVSASRAALVEEPLNPALHRTPTALSRGRRR